VFAGSEEKSQKKGRKEKQKQKLLLCGKVPFVLCKGMLLSLLAMTDATTLPFCMPPRAEAETIPCTSHGNRAHSNSVHPRLCEGVQIMLRANCSQLGSLDFMIDVIERIGLVNDARGARLYGPASKYMIHGSGRAGLWQEPQQIAKAMISVAQRVRVQRYVEVGVFTAWTTTVVAAYMSRQQGGDAGRVLEKGAAAPAPTTIAPSSSPVSSTTYGSGFQGLAVDITSSHIAPGTLSLLAWLDVKFISRKHFDVQVLPNLAWRFDLCFIDGDHSYNGVRADFSRIGPSCHNAMFHDIKDTSCLAAAEYSGGVPLFWQHLRQHLGPVESSKRTLELTHQGSTYLPMFGIWVVWKGSRGTAQLDNSSDVTVWPKWRGRGPDALWPELCGGHVRERGVPYHAVCTVSRADTLATFVKATKRTVRKTDLLHVVELWNKRDGAPALLRARR
jgi:hypothetical protein